MKNLIDRVSELCKSKHGKNISIYDNSFLEQSINSRMILANCSNPKDYYILISNMESEGLAFLNSLNNSHSEFFRNPLTFAIIEQHILPSIFKVEENSHNGGIRIWSAGCALGQEPYSIAILCEEIVQSLNGNSTYKIFATDISINEIFGAKNGKYEYNAMKNIKLSHLNNYFSRKNDSYSISEKIKEHIDFSYYDLLNLESYSPSASIYGDFDIVFCSNVLFYYKPEIQEFIISKIRRSLKRGGYFVTGEAETAIVKSFKGFKQYVPIASIFVKS
jgi:chemotaxis methyl-accepting protein methylase